VALLRLLANAEQISYFINFDKIFVVTDDNLSQSHQSSKRAVRPFQKSIPKKKNGKKATKVKLE
jgi:hypothetical protein